MNESNSIKIAMRWSDLDANMHVRHSIYYDWTDFARMNFFAKIGLTIDVFFANHIGPIIFREEGIFHKEIVFGNDIFVKIFLLKSTRDFRKWSILHEIWKGDNTLCATVIVDGSWIDTKIRKVIVPVDSLTEIMNQIPKHHDYELIPEKTK